MKAILASLALLGLVASTAGAQTGSTTGTSKRDCKVVEMKPGETPPGVGLSTSITAGGGKVTGTITGPGGTTTHSSSGGSGSFATSSSSDGQSTIVTDSEGNCTIYQSKKSK